MFNKRSLSLFFWGFIAVPFVCHAKDVALSGEITSDASYTSSDEVTVASSATINKNVTLSCAGTLRADAYFSVSGTLDTDYRAYIDSGAEISVTGTWTAAGKTNAPTAANNPGVTTGSAIYFYDGTISVEGSGKLVLGGTQITGIAASGIIGGSNIYVSSPGGILSLDSAENMEADFSALETELDSFSWKIVTSYVDKLTVEIGNERFVATDTEKWNAHFKDFVVRGYEDWEKEFSYDGRALYLNFTRPVPEPSAFGLLAGVGALAFGLSRRNGKRRLTGKDMN